MPESSPPTGSQFPSRDAAWMALWQQGRRRRWQLPALNELDRHDDWRWPWFWLSPLPDTVQTGATGAPSNAPQHWRRNRAWAQTAAQAGEQFERVSELLPGPPDERAVNELARAARFASAQAFDARAQEANGSVALSLITLLAAVLLAAFAGERWSFRPGSYVAVLGVEFAVSVVALVLGGLLVSASRNFAPWPSTVRLYTRTVLYAVTGVASVAAVLTLSQSHHHLTTFEKVAISSPLGLLALVIGLWCAIAAVAVAAWARRPPDPYPELLLGLLEALDDLRGLRVWRAERNVAVLPGELRCQVADTLEGPAWALRAHASMCTRAQPEVSREVAYALYLRGRRVAAWLADLQAQMLWPQGDGGAAVQQQLAQGFIDACAADWTALERDPAPVPSGAPSRAVRLLPRVALSAALLAAAFLLPDLFGKTLSAGAHTALTASLIVTALSALLAPRDAVSTVADDLYRLGKPEKPDAGSTHPQSP